MEKDLCSICMKQLYCSPSDKEINNIKTFCGKPLGFSSTFCANILEQAHREIIRTNCKHSYHRDCYFEYIEKSNCIKCPLCRENIILVTCFSRNGKNIKEYFEYGIIDCASYNMRIIKKNIENN